MIMLGMFFKVAKVVDARFSGNGGLQSTRDNMARGEDILKNTQIGDLDTSNSIIQSPKKLENGIIVKAQHVINECKGGSGLLKVGVQCGSN
jgi:hypothetical protein